MRNADFQTQLFESPEIITTPTKSPLTTRLPKSARKNKKNTIITDNSDNCGNSDNNGGNIRNNSGNTTRNSGNTRSTRHQNPISYLEPSLNSKIRKGHSFFPKISKPNVLTTSTTNTNHTNNNTNINNINTNTDTDIDTDIDTTSSIPTDTL